MDREKGKIRRKSTRKRQAWGLPWFREYDGWWYVTIRGQKRKLVKGNPDDEENNRQAALDEWHRVMALVEAESNKGKNPVWVILENFLDHKSRESPKAYERYLPFCQSFKDKYPDLRVDDLKPRHINEWLALQPWNESTQSLGSAVILAGLNWAAKPEQSIIDRNPIRGMKRPSVRSRGAETVIDDSDFQILLDNAPPWIRDALFFLRQTGTRPVNLARIEAKTIDAEYRCVRVEVHKTRDKTKRPLIIPLTLSALNLLLRLAEKYPEGPLFRTHQGKPMNSRLFTMSFQYLKKKLKRNKIALKGKVIAYGIRHTVATELLKKDVPDAKVAFILGHKNTAMLYHHYGHLDTASRSIAEELDSTINGDGAAPAKPAS